ncbi:MAG: MBL fold metallo-hydrolase [Promethearchaeati archaeon SRVP18_Atabeyarchaeia-1]
MRIEKISDNVYVDTTGEGNGNFGAIVLPSFVVAVDASMFPSLAQAFRKDIETRTEKRVAILVLTHYHADHVFGNQVYRDCTIVSTKELREKMLEAARTEWTPEAIKRFGQGSPETAEKLKGIEITFPTKTFESKYAFKDEGILLELRQTGGHTADSCYVYLPSEKILFSGDLIFAQRFPWGADPTADPEKWLKALKQLTKLKPSLIVPGHGPVCGDSELQKYIDFFEKTTKIIRGIVSSGGSKEEVLKFKDYPEFYAPKRPEAKQATLSCWYDYYRKRL